MKIKLFWIWGMVLLLAGCARENAGDPESGFLSVEVQDHPGNVLRKIITFNTEEEVSCHIEFWKEADRSDLVRTKESRKASRHEITLLMMKENSDYQGQIVDEDGNRSSLFTFRTGAVDPGMKAFLLKDQLETTDFSFDGYILYANKQADYMLMIDDAAEIVWYEKFNPVFNSSFSYRRDRQTISFMHGKSEMKGCSPNLSCIDLYGNRLMEASDQTLKNNLMHHDLYQLKDGNWIYTDRVSRDYDFSPLGLDEIRTVCGDGLTIINDRNEVLWEWVCFDHLNPLEDPNILFVDKKPTTSDWMHTNSIVEDENGDLYISCNRMKQFMKIDRETGEVLYRLGFNGDISIGDEFKPDRLHSLELGADGEILLFENGDRDREYSRILSFRVNEQEKTAECLTHLTLPLELRSSYNSNAYRMDPEHFLVHSTAKYRTAVVDRQGEVLWTLPVKGLSFRAIYVPADRF